MSEKIKIIVVEDEHLIALDIKRTLLKIGYDVVGMVDNGEEAVLLAGDLKPDLIFMDINLNGEMDGVETAEIIYQSYNIPVVFLTALSDSLTVNKAKMTEPFGYIIKPFDYRILKTSVEMAIYKHSIEKELRQRTKELEIEKIKTDNLLHNILPIEIVDEYKKNSFIAPRHYDNISIMFTDLQEFSEIASHLSPKKLVDELNNLFSDFDSIIDGSKIEKLKTIGDSYMIGAGLPNICEDHAQKLVDVAIKMQSYLAERNKTANIKWRMRIGINSGPAVAGVVGTDKFTYDVWGDTVNIASRMESSCEPGKINISGSTYQLIQNNYKCDYRGKLNAKGKGEIDMYYVLFNSK
jgi:class 3 adenylate cyclase/AmiR/NasT family two-component response regulator